MRELNLSEIEQVNGGALTWDEGKTAILGLAFVGLTVGTGGVGLFGLAVWGSMAYID